METAKTPVMRRSFGFEALALAKGSEMAPLFDKQEDWDYLGGDHR
jgi:hypothetical protein